MKPFNATGISTLLAVLVGSCSGAEDRDEWGTHGAGTEPISAQHGGAIGDGAVTDDDDTEHGDPAPVSNTAETPTDSAGGSDAITSGDAAGSTGGEDAMDGCAGAATGGGGGAGAAAIHATAWLQPDSCDRSVGFEVRDVRDQLGTPVADYTCEWTFSDGRSMDTCTGRKMFGELPGTFTGTVVVRDSRTGATTTATSQPVQVIEPQAIDVFASSDSCMHFSYDIDRQYGCGGVHVLDIQPASSILTPGPWSRSSQTLQVSAPGVYTVTYTVEGCASSYARECVVSDTASITVEACP